MTAQMVTILIVNSDGFQEHEPFRFTSPGNNLCNGFNDTGLYSFLINVGER